MLNSKPKKQRPSPKSVFPTLGSQNDHTYGIIKGINHNGQGGPGTNSMTTIQPPQTSLSPGMSGAEVSALQNWLISQGYKIQDGATGYFGNQTKAALTKYQSDNGINVQGNAGFYGPITREYIAKSQIKPAGGTTTSTQGSTTTSSKKSNEALVRFTSDPNGGAQGDESTLWLVDMDAKTMRPIMSDKALQDLYGPELQNAIANVNELSPSAVMPGGKFSSYTMLDSNYGIYDGRKTNPLEFDPSAIKYTYGQTVTPEANAKAAQALDGWMSLLKKNLSTSGLSQKTIDATLNDKVAVAAYLGAMAYGGYSPVDVYMDMKKREMTQQGNTSVAGMRVIDPNYTKRDYMNTAQGQEAYSKMNSFVPGRIGSLDRSVFSSALAQMPNSFYQAAFPELNPESKEFKGEMEKIKSTLHDSILQSISANTDAEKAAADFVWKNARDQFEKNYGIKLEDNALAAWNQIQKIESSYSEAGISASGLEHEAIDDSLALARTSGDRIRDEKAQGLLSKEMAYYTSSASPEEIQKMNTEDAAKGLPRDQWRSVQWGLAPKTAMTSSQFLSDWKNKNKEAAKNYSNQEILDKYYNPFYDNNGNFRSALYQKQVGDQFKTIYGYDPGAIPTTSLKDYQQGMVMAQNQDKIAKDEAWKTSTPLPGEEGWSAQSVLPGDQTLPPELRNQGTNAPANSNVDYTFHKGQETPEQYMARTAYKPSGTTTQPTPIIPTGAVAPKPVIDYTFRIGKETIEQYNQRTGINDIRKTLSTPPAPMITNIPSVTKPKTTGSTSQSAGKPKSKMVNGKRVML